MSLFAAWTGELGVSPLRDISFNGNDLTGANISAAVVDYQQGVAGLKLDAINANIAGSAPLEFPDGSYSLCFDFQIESAPTGQSTLIQDGVNLDALHVYVTDIGTLNIVFSGLTYSKAFTAPDYGETHQICLVRNTLTDEVYIYFNDLVTSVANQVGVGTDLVTDFQIGNGASSLYENTTFGYLAVYDHGILYEDRQSWAVTGIISEGGTATIGGGPVDVYACAEFGGLITSTEVEVCAGAGSFGTQTEVEVEPSECSGLDPLTITGSDAPIVGDTYAAAGGKEPYVFSYDGGSINPETGQIISVDDCSTSGAIATVSVTDACSTIANISVRQPGGVWQLIENYSSSCNALMGGGGVNDIEIVDAQFWRNIYFRGVSGTLTTTDFCDGVGCETYLGYACQANVTWEEYFGNDDYSYTYRFIYPSSYTVYEWQCP